MYVYSFVSFHLKKLRTSHDPLIKLNSIKYVVFLGATYFILIYVDVSEYSAASGLVSTHYTLAMEAARYCQKLVSGKAHGVTFRKTLILILSLLS
jgi:hypothetical protein